MHQCTTPAAAPQPQQFPKVSHRLLLRINARRDAARRRVPSGPVLAVVDATWRNTHGDRFAARRAGWAVVDSLMQQGRA